MLIKILIVAISLRTSQSAPSESAPVRNYDQRQTGSINIHLSIKDLSIIALDGDESESPVADDTLYDEEYDYNLDQLTINPASGLFTDSMVSSTHKPTTLKPMAPTNTKPDFLTTNRPHNIQDIINSSNKPPTYAVIGTNDHLENEKPGITPPPTSMTTPTPNKTPNVVIIEESAAPPSTLATILEATYNSSGNIQQIPVQVYMESSLPTLSHDDPKSHYILNRFAQRPSVEILGDVATRSSVSSAKPALKCNAKEYLDKSGKCLKRRRNHHGGHDKLRRIFELLMQRRSQANNYHNN